MALVNDRPGFARRLRGVVRTVIRHNKNIDKLLGILLRAHTADELRNDGFLVARGNQHTVAVQLLRFEDFLLF